MATPMYVFNEIAERYHVDPTDEVAVDKFFQYRVPRLPKRTRQSILDELLARDGESPTSKQRLKTLPRTQAKQVAAAG